MDTKAIAINGTETALVAAGFMTWTASDISLRLCPNMTWAAVRGEISANGSTAQEAADNLAAAERKAEKAAKLVARSTKGQNFAREMRAHLHIGARTRRHRKNGDLHTQILEAITNAAWYEGYYEASRQDIFRTAMGAWMSYNKHIAGYRANCNVISHIKALSPYQFVGLIADMIDAEITNVGEGEIFFAEMGRRLYAQAA